MNDFAVDNSPRPKQIQEHEPIFIQYVSAVSGRIYDDEVVDHLADMLLIFYCGGGTALGAIAGASLGFKLILNSSNPAHALLIILFCGFAGSIAGCLLVMTLLNFRGLLKWDGLVLRRSIRLKR